MKDLDTWETRRQNLISFLEIQNLTLDLREIMREMEYSNKKELINDIMSRVLGIQHRYSQHTYNNRYSQCINHTFHFSSTFLG